MMEAERRGVAIEAPASVELPIVGSVDVRTMSLPAFTVLIGLFDD